MKDKLWIFAMGFFVAISLAGMVSGDMLVIKPAKPVATVVDYSMTPFGAQTFIKQYIAQGYQVRQVVHDGNGLWTIMEKY